MSVTFFSLFVQLLLFVHIYASPLNHTYDVIVVGSGPAGVIIASRLSENGTRNVLLLEGGGPSYWVTGGRQQPSWLEKTNLSRVDVPGLYSSIFSNASNPLLCHNKILAYGACTIGGNSAINAGLFYEPPPSDFDNYFPAGWKHTDVAPAIARLYATQPSTNKPSLDGRYYEQSGYTAAQKWLVTNADYTELDINANAANKTKVFGHPVYDYSNGQRSGPVISYLQDALKRTNFHLLSGVWVQRVIRSGGTATGVVVNIRGNTSTISLNTRGRVILSGGALKSPELLMKSGIGDPAVLTTLSKANQLGGLPASQWINNTAVGAGLFDNPNTFIELSSPAIRAYSYVYDNPIDSDAKLYLHNKSGPYSFAGGSCSFWDTITRDDGSVAGVQGGLGAAGYQDYTNSSTVTMNIYGTSGLKSTGNVILSPPDYLPGPSGKVYYSDSQDAKDIATFIRRLFDALPGTGLTPLNLDQNSNVTQIRNYITSYTPYTRGQVNHWSSSCRIGTCVDVNTTVIGMKNLHVVDAKSTTTAAAAGPKTDNTNSSAQPQQVTGFLRLPPELRVQIYHYLFDSQTLTITWSHPSPSERRALRNQGQSVRKQFRRTRTNNNNGGETAYPAAILHTSCLLRQEASIIFYQQTRFRFDFGANPIFGLNAFYKRGLADPTLIRTIELELNLRTEPYRGWREVSLVMRLGRWVRHFPTLKELKLVYPHKLGKHDLFLGEGVPEHEVSRHGRWLGRGVELLVEGHEEVNAAQAISHTWFARSRGFGPAVPWGPGDLSWRRIESIVWRDDPIWQGEFWDEVVSDELVERDSGKIIPISR